jgi:polysaccharide deacetylase family protein (PEP-CTERM system associated)
VTVAHALSVDVEDWFQVLNMAHVVDRSEWDRFELRCGDSTRRLLDLFARRGARATFFFLGWVAERMPDLVREVAAAGHEVGSHGYDHRMLPDLGEAGFAADVERTAGILQGITGRRPTAFRACTWSVTARTPWAPAVLARSGIRTDSSIQPVRHPDYGVPGAPVSPWRLETGDGSMVEFPPLTLQCLGRRLPVGGGGYLRLFPVALLRAGLRQQEAHGMPGCIYLHPWEVDPDQPRRQLGLFRGFRHYVNLRRTLAKLDALLQETRFLGLEEVLAQRGSNWLAKLPAYRATELLG